MEPVETGTAFRLGDGVPGPLPAILGPWSPAPTGISFDAAGDRATVWSVRLPAEDLPAGRVLREAERELALVREAVPQAEQRLRLAAAPTIAQTFAQGEPETELVAALATVRSELVEPASSFGVALSDEAWVRAHAAFASMLEHLRHLVTGESWVETSIDGTLVGRTMIGRLGDQSTAWKQAATSESQKLHTRAVALSLASSAELARSLDVAIRGVALIGMLASGPGAAILALPAVWAFIDDVVSRFRQSRVGDR